MAESGTPLDPRERDICLTVARARNGGLPDVLIAQHLGVTVEQLRRICPGNERDPLGLHPPYPLDRGPLSPQAPPIEVPPRDPGRVQNDPPWGRAALPGEGFALLAILMLLGTRSSKRRSSRPRRRRRSERR